MVSGCVLLAPARCAIQTLQRAPRAARSKCALPVLPLPKCAHHTQPAQQTTPTANRTSSASEARLRRAVGTALHILRQRWDVKRWTDALDDVGRAAKADPDALLDERHLRVLGAVMRCATGEPSGADGPACLLLARVLEYSSAARALQLVRADGVAAGLEAGLRGSMDAKAFAAVRVMQLAVRHQGAARALLDGAPGLFELVAVRLAACAPLAAALEAGVDIAAAAAAAAAAGDNKALRDELLSLLYQILGSLERNTASGLDPRSREAGALADVVVPVLVALLAHPSAATARSAAAAALVAGIKLPAAAAVLFRCGGRGVLRAAEALLSQAARKLEGGTDSEQLGDGRADARTAAAMVTVACQAAIMAEAQLLTTPVAEPWAAAAPRLAPRFRSTQRLIHQAAAAGGDDNGADCRPMELPVAAEALELIAAWVPRARRVAAEAAQSGCAAGPAGFDGSSNGAGGDSDVAAAPRRCCAACGCTPADGARLHRCRGCGAFTGVMYCGDACAREHWVRRGHRKVCEPASAQVRAVIAEAKELFHPELVR